MSAGSEDASVAATLALVRAAGIPGYTTGEKTGTAAGELTAWEQGLTAQERADMTFLRKAGAIKPGGGA